METTKQSTIGPNDEVRLKTPEIVQGKFRGSLIEYKEFKNKIHTIEYALMWGQIDADELIARYNLTVESI